MNMPINSMTVRLMTFGRFDEKTGIRQLTEDTRWAPPTEREPNPAAGTPDDTTNTDDRVAVAFQSRSHDYLYLASTGESQRRTTPEGRPTEPRLMDGTLPADRARSSEGRRQSNERHATVRFSPHVQATMESPKAATPQRSSQFTPLTQ